MSKGTYNVIFYQKLILWSQMKEICQLDCSCERPGVLLSNIKLFKDFIADRSCKICINGKKINCGFGKRLEEADMYLSTLISQYLTLLTYIYHYLPTCVWPNVALITLILSYFPLIALMLPNMPYSPDMGILILRLHWRTFYEI